MRGLLCIHCGIRICWSAVRCGKVIRQCLLSTKQCFDLPMTVSLVGSSMRRRKRRGNDIYASGPLIQAARIYCLPQCLMLLALAAISEHVPHNSYFNDHGRNTEAYICKFMLLFMTKMLHLVGARMCRAACWRGTALSGAICLRYFSTCSEYIAAACLCPCRTVEPTACLF